jgi:hypothetical protein
VNLEAWLLSPFSSMARDLALPEIEHAHQKLRTSIRSFIVRDQQSLDYELTKFRTKTAQSSG